MSDLPLKSEFFVTRISGDMVALLAVDELPHHITIAGVSRVMSAFDIAGMTCVGRSVLRHRYFKVKDAPELAATNTSQSLDPLKAKYFITRDSGNMVPLVAMDEMPPEFVTEGVPRTLSVFDIIGMTSVGVSDARERVHIVQDVKNAPMSYFTKNIKPQHAESIKSESAYGTPELLPISPAFEALPEPAFVSNGMNPAGSKPVPRTPAGIEVRNENAGYPELSVVGVGGTADNIPAYKQYFAGRVSTVPNPATHSVNGNTRSIKPLKHGNTSLNDNPRFSNENINGGHCASPHVSTSTTTTPFDTPNPSITLSSLSALPGVKEYCSYWIRHGECDYQQQGCLYKHEMPLDQETLLRLGLRDIPRWYREKHSLGSYLAAGGSGAAFSGHGLKSAAATGTHEDDKKNNMARNWRTGAGTHLVGTPQSASPFDVSRGNSQNGLNRVVMNPSSYNRFPNGKPTSGVVGRKHRYEGTTAARQPYDHTKARDVYDKTDSMRKHPIAAARTTVHNTNNATFTGSPAGPATLVRRDSASTLASDIEATIYRQTTARRDKEDAEYKKICDADAAQQKKLAEEANKVAEQKKEAVTRPGRSISRNPAKQAAGRRRQNRSTVAGEKA